MTDQLGDAPIQDRYREQMTAIVAALDEVFNGTARGADRRDVVALMKEMVARFEGQPALSGRA